MSGSEPAVQDGPGPDEPVPYARKGSAAERADPAPPLPSHRRARGLLENSPFRVGFVGVVGGLLAIGLVGLVVQLQQILVIAVLSLFLALGINPLVDWLIRRGFKRMAALAMVILLILVVLALALWAIVPMVSQQGLLLINNAPGYLKALRDNPQIAALDRQFSLISRFTEFVTSGTWVNALFGGLLGAGVALATTAFSGVMTVVLTLYFLSSLPAIKDTIYQLSPASRRDRVRFLANGMFDRIGNYLTGMFGVVTLWAAGSFIVMTIVGLGQYALALCIVVGALAFIPVVGWMFGAVIVCAIALTVSPMASIVCLIYFIGYSQMDAYLVQPRIFSRSLNVPPVLIIIGALAGGSVLGIVGALLAIPTVASLLLLYREVLIPHLDNS